MSTLANAPARAGYQLMQATAPRPPYIVSPLPQCAIRCVNEEEHVAAAAAAQHPAIHLQPELLARGESAIEERVLGTCA